MCTFSAGATGLGLEGGAFFLIPICAAFTALAYSTLTWLMGFFAQAARIFDSSC